VTTGRTDLGVGYVGSGGTVGLPSRNPIGFAPSADPDRDLPSESRFHTEISFKRHSSTVSPRASSPSAGGSGDSKSRIPELAREIAVSYALFAVKGPAVQSAALPPAPGDQS